MYFRASNLAAATAAAIALTGLMSAAPSGAPSGAARAQTGPQGEAAAAFSGALDLAGQDDWIAAEIAAERVGVPVAADIVQWLRLLDGEADWREYADFLSRHPDWPREGAVRAQAERAMDADLDPLVVTRFFAGDRPRSGTGALRLARALESLGRVGESRDVAIRAWTRMSLTPDEQGKLLAEFRGALGAFHTMRLDMLLWRGLTREAQGMFPLVDDGWRRLAEARIALRRTSRGVDGLIASVPSSLADDPGLAFERMEWRVKKGRWDEAEALLSERTGSRERLGEPERWADRRLNLAHRAMRNGRNRDAYRLASRHFLDGGSDYAELEWLAGWLALRKLGDAKTALRHFERFEKEVETPISVGRGFYWIGRAREALGDTAGAMAAYAKAANEQTAFYGQLAAERIGAEPDGGLIAAAPPAGPQAEAFMARSVARAGALLLAAGEERLAYVFLTRAAETAVNAEELAALIRLCRAYDANHIAVRAAKTGVRKGIMVQDGYYPVTDLATYGVEIEPALALSIARTESELNPGAISPAGARGLMQLMPATAQKMAGQIGERFSRDRLTNDWRYNARLGQAYLAGLIEIYRSLPLAAAAYNAGPQRVDQWLAEYGDPRRRGVDMVDWIETIPFSETRNYVMRVIEGLHVYRARIAGGPRPIRISEDLTRAVR